jgi:hypothetical protein
MLLGCIALASSSSAEETVSSAFLFAYGGSGSASGQFDVGRGVAVRQSSGNVYVVDQQNQRVEQFGPWGAFERMFGDGVNATTHADTCAAGEACGAGTEGTAGGQFKVPQGVAVDQSSGDVYVVDYGNHRIEKFGPTGEFLLAFGKEVDATTPGNVCTAASGNVCQAGTAGTGEGEDEFEWAVGSFIAVGPDGNVYVGDENRVQEFEPTGAYLGQIALPGVGKITALAVGPSGSVYVGSTLLAGVHVYNAAGSQQSEISTGGATVDALALDSSGDLLVGESEPPYRVTEYGPSGSRLASFGREQLGEGSSSGIGLGPSGTVYLSEKTAPFRVLAFGNPPPGEPPLVAPSIDSQSVTDLGVSEAVVGAQIDPHFLATRYYAEYGTDTSYSLGDVPTAPGATLGGGEVQADQPASVTLPDLAPGTLYHYRFVAESKAGTARGPDETFTTFTPPTLSGLPDGRVYEQVSSQKKNGNEAGIELQSGGLVPGYAVATPDGERVVFFQVGPSGETSSGTDLYSVATRNPQTGWQVSAALPPGFGSNASNFTGEEPKAFVPSADLSRFLFATTYSFQEENPDATESTGLYRAGEADPLEAEWWLSRPAFASFSEAKPEPGHIQQKWPLPVGGSPTLSTAYFTWNATLVPEDAERAKHVTVHEGDPEGPYGFYEWHEGTLKSAGELPDGEYSGYGAVPAATTTTGEITPSPLSLRNEVSEDGSKAYFVSPDPGNALEAGRPTELYVREQHESAGEPASSVLVSRNELNGGKEAEGSGATTAVTPVSGAYVYASPDGSRAFFESEDKLALSSTGTAPEGSGPWTYEFSLTSEKLTYLPGVDGDILASAQDGSSFLFENPATHKIELWSGGPAPTEIAAYSAPATARFQGARATSSGTAFVFATNAVLSPGSFNNSAGENQLYRFEPGASEPLICVSCAPSGTAQDPASAIIRSRTIADGGREVFFGTAEKLVPEDTNGVEDAYEWEQQGTGSCPSGEPLGCTYLISPGTGTDPSFYLDNSESGSDAFIATRAGLVAGDTDGAYDVYDARVGGGFSTQAPPPGCTSDCQAPPPPAPSFGAPVGSAVWPAGENVPPPKAAVLGSKSTQAPKPLTRVQKLAKALKACKSKPKKERAACEKQAEHSYGAKAAKKSKKKSEKEAKR